MSNHNKADSAARVNARPGGGGIPGPPGLHHLRVGRNREALLHVPENGHASAPLAVMLHGAGGKAQHGLDILGGIAASAGVIVLAPESQKNSWDVISSSRYGPDVSLIDKALEEVFARYSIDERRVALGGFSYGASYALPLVLINGLLF